LTEPSIQLLRHSLISGDDFIEGVGDLSLDAEMVPGYSYREVSTSHRLERVKQLLRRVGIPVCVRFDFGTTTGGRSARAEITHGIPLKQKRTRNCAVSRLFAASNRAADRKSSKYLSSYRCLGSRKWYWPN
jgi:hypothetical protein